MDASILVILNKSLAHPVLDVFMVLASTVGLASLPLYAILFLRKGDPTAARNYLLVMLFGLALALIFQYLALRPRPTDIRFVIPTPATPSFPSGHATVAYAAMVFVALVERKRRVWVVGIAFGTWIAWSRVFLGVHFPTDVLAGAVLGISVGAAGYGFYRHKNTLAGWRWMAGVQIAVALLTLMMTYMNQLPSFMSDFPWVDKFFHFTLYGLIAFWLELWFPQAQMHIRGYSISLVLVLMLGFASGEELSQTMFSHLRTPDWLDLMSNIAGIVFFTYLAAWIHPDAPAPISSPTLSTKRA